MIYKNMPTCIDTCIMNSILYNSDVMKLVQVQSFGACLGMEGD